LVGWKKKVHPIRNGVPTSRGLWKTIKRKSFGQLKKKSPPAHVEQKGGKRQSPNRARAFEPRHVKSHLGEGQDKTKTQNSR